MIKSIKYSMGISNLDFNNGDFIGYRVELNPVITIDVEFENSTIRDVSVYYTRYGFVVELNTKKISLVENKELENYLNHNKEFQKEFDEFMFSIKSSKKCGGIS